MKKITVNVVTELLKEALARNKKDLTFHHQVVKMLTPLNGQTFTTKRIEKVLLPGWTLSTKYGMYHLNRPKDPKNPDKYLDHLIGYQNSGDGLIDTSKIYKFDGCHSHGAEERIKQIEGFLNEPGAIKDMAHNFAMVQKAMEDLKRYNTIIEGGQLTSFHNPIYYELLRLTGAESKLMQALKYNKEMD